MNDDALRILRQIRTCFVILTTIASIWFAAWITPWVFDLIRMSLAMSLLLILIAAAFAFAIWIAIAAFKRPVAPSSGNRNVR